MDEEPEVDNGYVTLVNAKYDKNGELVETPERPTSGRGSTRTRTAPPPTRRSAEMSASSMWISVITRIRSFCTTSRCTPSPVRRSRSSVQPAPGKSDLTNLINRFYDLADGKIRYDGININKNQKADLRRSLGIVLQDTNLFTGTIRDNIRYGRLDATDEEVVAAAQLANADDFIRRLPDGYDTVIDGDGGSLSPGSVPAAFHRACGGCRSAGYDPR